MIIISILTKGQLPHAGCSLVVTPFHISNSQTLITVKCGFHHHLPSFLSFVFPKFLSSSLQSPLSSTLARFRSPSFSPSRRLSLHLFKLSLEELFGTPAPTYAPLARSHTCHVLRLYFYGSLYVRVLVLTPLFEVAIFIPLYLTNLFSKKQKILMLLNTNFYLIIFILINEHLLPNLFPNLCLCLCKIII